jgi:hypothetical protein
MNWLQLFVPVAIGLEFVAPEQHLLVFATSSLAILPLAGWMGRATEDPTGSRACNYLPFIWSLYSHQEPVGR